MCVLPIHIVFAVPLHAAAVHDGVVVVLGQRDVVDHGSSVKRPLLRVRVIAQQAVILKAVCGWQTLAEWKIRAVPQHRQATVGCCLVYGAYRTANLTARDGGCAAR